MGILVGFWVRFVVIGPKFRQFRYSTHTDHINVDPLKKDARAPGI
jgi:hypothetical protein